MINSKLRVHLSLQEQTVFSLILLLSQPLKKTILSLNVLHLLTILSPKDGMTNQTGISLTIHSLMMVIVKLTGILIVSISLGPW